MQHSLSIKQLPQASYSGHQHYQEPQSQEPLCGAFAASAGYLCLGSSGGNVSCISLGPHGSAARRVLGHHAGRVTGLCHFPWAPACQQQRHHNRQQSAIPAVRSSTVGHCASTAADARSSFCASSFFASCSADSTVKLWTCDAKALHATDACLQTLRGHKAAVTCLAAVQVTSIRRGVWWCRCGAVLSQPIAKQPIKCCPSNFMAGMAGIIGQR